MNSAVVVLLVAFASANAGIIAAPAAQILQGPSSRTTIVGPDGSSISAAAPGGSVIIDQQPALIAQAAPALIASRSIISSPAILSAPSLLPSSGIIASSGLISAPLVARSGLVASGLGETIIAGPSGTIAAAGPLAAPGVISPLAVW